MNADRLLKFAIDFVDEYDKNKLLALLQETTNLCANRPQNTDGNFVQKSNSIIERAKQVKNNTKFLSYPPGYLSALEGSKFLRMLPDKVADFIIHGVTADVETTMSAAESKSFMNSATNSFNELSTLINILRGLGVQPIQIDDDHISLEFSLPRQVFGNFALGYFRLNEKVAAIIEAYNELAGAAEAKPKLVFTATSDPVVGFLADVHAAYAVVQLVKALLDTAKSAVQLYATCKSLRDSKAFELADQVDQKVAEIMETKIREIVEETAKKFESKLSEGRQNELVNKIHLNAKVLMPVLVRGASLSVSPESIERVRIEDIERLTGDERRFIVLVEESRKAEAELQIAVHAAGGESFPLIENSDGDTPQGAQRDE